MSGRADAGQSSANAIVLALDACDPRIARGLAAAGRMPVLQSLLTHAAVAETRNPYGFFVSAVWPTIFTACTPATHNYYCWEQIDAGTYQHRFTTPREIERPPFWDALSDAGKRVAIIDVPHSRAVTPLNGIQLVEWGCHDRHFGLHSWPPALAGEVESTFGLHPIGSALDTRVERQFAGDDYVHRVGPLREPHEEKALVADLLASVSVKNRLSLHYLEQGGWDLYLSVFGEGHGVGHQLWHLHDPAHPRHGTNVAAELGDPLVEVYERLDAAIGDHLAHVQPDTTVFVLLSHGMGPHYDGTHLLDHVLRRLEIAREGGPQGSALTRAAKRLYSEAPRGMQRIARPVAAEALRARRRSRTPLPDEDPPMIDRATRPWFRAPNNTVYGGIRINLQGREPDGQVAAADYNAVRDELTAELLALWNVDTGAPVVDRVVRTEDVYDRRDLDAFPDLIVDWRRDAEITTVYSPRVGIVHVPYEEWRTGDHRPDGLLLATGPGIPVGARLAPIESIDLAPTIAARLGVELPDVDGRPVSVLSARR